MEFIIALKDTHESFCEKLNKINPNIKVIGEYIKSKQKIDVECVRCGHKWAAFPYNLITGEGCPNHRRGKAYKTHQAFISDLFEINPDVEVKSTYVSAKSKVKCLCRVCGHTWEATPSNLQCGFGCPICRVRKIKEKQRKTHATFVKEVEHLTSDISVVGRYINFHTKIEFMCNNCGLHWVAEPASILSAKSGCPHCCSSKGEKRIVDWLNLYDIQYTPQMKYVDLIGVGGGLLSYDFYIHEQSLLIEYQGQFHDGSAHIQSETEYLIQTKHDKRKLEYAIDHNIKLLQIWYYDFNNIEKILEKNIAITKSPSTTTALPVTA